MAINDWNHSESDERDRELNAALAKYAAVQPREGLESRVLANLHTQQTQPSFAWWRWAWVATMTVALIVAALLWKSEMPRRRATVDPAPAATRLEDSTQFETKQRERSSPPDQPAPIRSTATPKTIASSRRSTSPVRANPRLDVFPSPQPLSTEELALARYVQQFPQEAVMVARMQEEYRQKTRERMREAGFEVPAESDSDPGSDKKESSN